MGHSLHRGASKGEHAEIARFHSNPEGQWVWGRPVRGARLGTPGQGRPARDARSGAPG